MFSRLVHRAADKCEYSTLLSPVCPGRYADKDSSCASWFKTIDSTQLAKLLCGSRSSKQGCGAWSCHPDSSCFAKVNDRREPGTALAEARVDGVFLSRSLAEPCQSRQAERRSHKASVPCRSMASQRSPNAQSQSLRSSMTASRYTPPATIRLAEKPQSLNLVRHRR